MTAPWIAAFVCLWVLVLGLAAVLAGVLRRVAPALEAVSAGGARANERHGPPIGVSLPELDVRHERGDTIRLSDLDGPFVLAVLNSQCDPCLAIIEWVSANQGNLDGLARLVVLSDAVHHDLGQAVSLLVDDSRRAIRGLDVPGTPFAIQVGADGRVIAASLLGGPDHLVRLLEASVTAPSGNGSAAPRLTVLQTKAHADHHAEGVRTASVE